MTSSFMSGRKPAKGFEIRRKTELLSNASARALASKQAKAIG
jgi:hypothetical protein